MLNYISNEKRTIFLLAADLFVITGVIFFNWNSARMAGFYYLDVCICILSFVIYNFITKNVSDPGSALMATAGILFLMYIAFIGVINLCTEMNMGDYSDNLELFFYPYYDVGIFLFCSSTVHAFNVRKYLSYDRAIAKPAFSLYVGMILLMVPFLLLMAFIINIIKIPMNISLVLSLILVRHYTEYRRFKSFRDTEAESKLREVKPNT